MAEPITGTTLKAQGISMRFAGVTVLDDVELTLRSGEVHGLVGENGAGKSTLLKIMGGVYRPSGGHIEINGTETVIPSPHAAIDFGIALIHQEPLTFPDLDVAENMFVGRQPVRRGSRLVHWGAMRQRAAEALEALGLTIEPRTRMRALSIAGYPVREMETPVPPCGHVRAQSGEDRHGRPARRSDVC